MFGFGSPSGSEFLVLMLIALLLFGKKLPEVARSLGKGLKEFQSGVRGLQDEVHKTTHEARSYTPADSSSTASRPVPEEEQQEDDFDVPKFELPSSAPTETYYNQETADSGDNAEPSEAEKAENA